ncbi:uncharacterized protein BKA78DRAFT_58915 [Phyllosticta capitalensis]|uniref:uncharacterized protein n=1 Tax=Phyllosticta capitalensis TaxID=121624 RepID=UPI00312F59C2
MGKIFGASTRDHVHVKTPASGTPARLTVAKQHVENRSSWHKHSNAPCVPAWSRCHCCYCCHEMLIPALQSLNAPCPRSTPELKSLPALEGTPRAHHVLQRSHVASSPRPACLPARLPQPASRAVAVHCTHPLHTHVLYFQRSLAASQQQPSCRRT